MKRIVCILAVIACAGFAYASGAQETGAAAKSGISVNKTGYPIVNEPITYEVMAIQNAWGRNWGEMPLFQQYEKLSGIKINWTMIPDSERVQKINLMLATASYPHVFMGAGGLGPKNDETLQSGVILSLNKLLQDWAPNIQKFYAAVPDAKAASTFPDGNIYGFMQYQNSSYHTSIPIKFFVNTKWMNTLKLQMPKTTEEFYALLKAFKEGDPNGNGKKDEIPLAFATTNQGTIAEWINYFGPWGIVDPVMVDKGKTYWGFEDPGFKEGAKFYRRLVQDGLLSKESIAQTADQRRARAIVNNEVVLGCAPSLAPQFIWNNMDMVFKYDDTLRTLDTMDQLKLNPKNQISVIAPLKGPQGKQATKYTHANGMVFNVAFIFKGAPVPEAMVRWFDHWYDGGRNGFSMSEGPEGIRWEQNPKTGAYIEFMPPKELGMELQEWRQWHTPVTTYFWDRNGAIKKPVLPRHVMLEEYTDEYLGSVPKEPFPANLVKSLDKEVDILTQFEEELMNYVWESMAKFIFGDVDIEKEWPNFLAQTKRMKSVELLAVKQAQYDRYVKALK